MRASISSTRSAGNLLYTPASPCQRWLGNLARGGGGKHAGKRPPRGKRSRTEVSVEVVEGESSPACSPVRRRVYSRSGVRRVGKPQRMKNGPDAAIHATSWSEPPTVQGVQRTNGIPTYDVAPACCNAGSPQLVCCWSADPWMGTESPESPTVAWNGLSRQSHLDQPRDKTWEHGRKPAAEGQGDRPWVPCWQGGHAKAAR